eukprot:m.340710 g.340710  ORF g.340710 m.340710 type:complete len:284 (-) comp20599_c0_seq1:1789-2640(-)
MSGSASAPVYGFLGCGFINTAIVRGLCRWKLTLDSKTSGQSEETLRISWPVVVSPRNAAKAIALVREFGEGLVRVAASNDELIACADVIVLGLTPPVADIELPKLHFDRPNQCIINLVSSISNETIQKIVGFSSASALMEPRVVKAVPLPPVAEHMGVTVVSPTAAYAVDLFNVMGEVVEVSTDVELHALQAATCLMGPFYKLVATAKDWMVQQKVPEPAAAKYAGALFRCIAHDSSKHNADALVREQTPGGLNEECIRRLTDGGVYAEVNTALDAILRRVTK